MILICEAYFSSLEQERVGFVFGAKRGQAREINESEKMTSFELILELIELILLYCLTEKKTRSNLFTYKIF